MEDYVKRAVETECGYSDYPDNPIARSTVLAVLKSMVSLGATAEDMKKNFFYGKALFGGQQATLNALQLRYVPEGSPEFQGDPKQTMRLNHGVAGLISETGEIAELIMDRLQQSSEDVLDPEIWKKDLFKELGDLFWYSAIICDVYGWSFDSIMQGNIAKLAARYKTESGVGFTQSSALNRDLEAETKAVDMALESGSDEGRAKAAAQQQHVEDEKKLAVAKKAAAKDHHKKH